jgi:hypothetical protein
MKKVIGKAKQKKEMRGAIVGDNLRTWYMVSIVGLKNSIHGARSVFFLI